MAQFYRFGSLGADGSAPAVQTGILTFWSVANAAAYSHIRKMAAGVTFPPSMAANSDNTKGYQVTAGKTLYIVRIRVAHRDAANSNQTFSLLYGDTDIGFNGAAAPTTPISLVGGTTFDSTPFSVPSTAENGIRDFSLYVPVPASKYMTIYGVSGNSRIYLEGFEV